MFLSGLTRDIAEAADFGKHRSIFFALCIIGAGSSLGRFQYRLCAVARISVRESRIEPSEIAPQGLQGVALAVDLGGGAEAEPPEHPEPAGTALESMLEQEGGNGRGVGAGRCQDQVLA